MVSETGAAFWAQSLQSSDVWTFHLCTKLVHVDNTHPEDLAPLAAHSGSYSAITVLEAGSVPFMGGLYMLPQFCKALDLRPGTVLFHR
jgi:hypothetical protein